MSRKWTRTEFVAFLRGTLIPDLRESGRDCTADDFETAIEFMTEQSAPTRGAWRVGDAGRTIFGPKSDQPAPVVIATLPAVSPRVSASEREGNARLIAAAPEMLAALQSIMPLLDADLDAVSNWQEEAEKCRQAIIRAKGGA